MSGVSCGARGARAFVPLLAGALVLGGAGRVEGPGCETALGVEAGTGTSPAALAGSAPLRVGGTGGVRRSCGMVEVCRLDAGTARSERRTKAIASPETNMTDPARMSTALRPRRALSDNLRVTSTVGPSYCGRPGMLPLAFLASDACATATSAARSGSSALAPERSTPLGPGREGAPAMGCVPSFTTSSVDVSTVCTRGWMREGCRFLGR